MGLLDARELGGIVVAGARQEHDGLLHILSLCFRM